MNPGHFGKCRSQRWVLNKMEREEWAGRGLVKSLWKVQPGSDKKMMWWTVHSQEMGAAEMMLVSQPQLASWGLLARGWRHSIWNPDRRGWTHHAVGEGWRNSHLILMPNQEVDSPPDVSTLEHIVKGTLLLRQGQSFLEYQHCTGCWGQGGKSNRHCPYPHETCSLVREIDNKQVK